MKFRELFSLPEGKRITEKYLYRVLILSVCSVLLCMGCLVGTTWAWFAVSIENTDNVIEIGEPSAALRVDGTEAVSGRELTSGEHTINVTNSGTADVFNKKSTLYVTFSVNGTVKGYVALEHTANIKITISEQTNDGADPAAVVAAAAETDTKYILTWTVSWIKPAAENVNPLVDNEIVIVKEAEDKNTPETPEVTETPPVTEAPETTEPPQVTQTPQPTESPQVTETPQSTEPPQVTETPQPTVPPQSTEPPTNTETDPNVNNA